MPFVRKQSTPLKDYQICVFVVLQADLSTPTSTLVRRAINFAGMLRQCQENGGKCSCSVVLVLLRCVARMFKVGMCYQESFKYIVYLVPIDYFCCLSVLSKYFITFETVTDLVWKSSFRPLPSCLCCWNFCWLAMQRQVSPMTAEVLYMWPRGCFISSFSF